MVDSAMSKMQKGKRPSEMSEARFKEKTLKPKVRPGDKGRYKAPKRRVKLKDMPGGNQVSKAAGIPYSTAEKFLGAPKSMLTKKQKTLPEGLKKKIIEAKKSGAGYSGD